VCSLFSCSQVESPDDSAGAPASDGLVRVTARAGDVDYNQARTVFPDAGTSAAAYWKLEGSRDGGARQTLIESFTGVGSCAISQGRWDFWLYGYDTGDNQILQGSITGRTVYSSGADLVFTVSTGSSGSGSINITFTLLEDSGITYAVITPPGGAAAIPLNAQDGKIVFQADSVSSGDYWYQFRFYDASGFLIASAYEVVQVRDDLSSRVTIPLSAEYFNTPPQAPNTPSITDGGSGTLHVSWDAVSGVGDYEIYYSTASSPPVTAAATVQDTEYDLGGLANFTEYHVWVRSVTAAGKSVHSEMAAGTPMPPSRSVTIQLYSPSEIDISSQTASIMKGNSQSFSVDSGYSSYQWYLDGVSIAGADSYYYELSTSDKMVSVYELTVTAIDPDDGFRYSGSCTVSVVPNTISPGINIVLSDNSDIDFSGQSVTVTRGNSQYFSVNHTEFTSFKWYLDGVEVPGVSYYYYTMYTSSMKLGVYELTAVGTGTDANGGTFSKSGSCYVTIQEEE
jgi:hypothetical protein